MKSVTLCRWCREHPDDMPCPKDPHGFLGKDDTERFVNEPRGVMDQCITGAELAAVLMAYEAHRRLYPGVLHVVIANTGLGKTKAREVAARLNRLRITVARRPSRTTRGEP